MEQDPPDGPVGIVWDSRQQNFSTYLEKDVGDLVEHLRRADVVVGFNILGFDYTVLRGYCSDDFSELRTLDILRHVFSHLNYRLSLDSLARATLGTRKSADGLQALQWFKEGRIDLIADYCTKDVEITRNLFQFGLDNGHLLFDRELEGRLRIPVSWDLCELAGRATGPHQMRAIPRSNKEMRVV